MKKYKDWADKLAEVIIDKVKLRADEPVLDVLIDEYFKNYRTKNPTVKKLVDTLIYRVKKNDDKYFIFPRKKNEYQEWDRVKKSVEGLLKLDEDGTYMIQIDYYLTEDEILSYGISRIE